MTILVTGAAGFIGFHLCKKLLEEHPNQAIVGVDNLNEYYDPSLKESRLKILQSHKNFIFYPNDIVDKGSLDEIFGSHQVTYVVNLAAQAGVRYSLENPDSYVQSNLVGFANLLDLCKKHQIEHLVFASSSSVYGANSLQPFAEHHSTEHPLSLYAATKKSNEMLAHSYAHLFRFPVTGLRFFTVYGPWGRPDMALFKFTKAVLANKPIEVYNHGQMVRDFTYIDDIVDAIATILSKPALPDPYWDSNAPNPGSSLAPYSIVNIGNHRPIPLMDFIKAIEKATGKPAQINYLPLQEGDVPSTFASVDKLNRDYHITPKMTLAEGVQKFVDWFIEYYGVATA